MNTVEGKTVAFIGFGHIAQTTAKMLQDSLKVKLSVLKRNKGKAADFENLGLKIEKIYSFEEGEESYNEIFYDADFVICSLPGTPDTNNFISAKQFELMKESSVFISLGRGTAIDEVALADALDTNSIAGAALDVFRVEPLPETSKLWNCKNLLISPHNADYTEEYFQLGTNVFIKNLEAFIRKEPFFTVVNKELGY